MMPKPLAKHFRQRQGSPPPPTPSEARRRLNQDRRRTGWTMLMILAQSRYLTVEQAAVLLYPTKTGLHSAAARLHQLWEDGLVEAFRPEREAAAGPKGGGSNQVVYMLSELGAQVIGDQLGIQPDWRPVEEEEALSAAYVPHRLAIGDLHAALTIYARQKGGHVEQFIYEPAITIGEQRKGITVRPDAALLYRQGDRAWPLTAEIDRGTETPARFARDKLPRYSALWESDDWRLYWPDDPNDAAAGGRPRVVVIVEQGGHERLMALKREVEEMLETGQATYRLYRFALAQDLYRLTTLGGQPQVALGFDLPVCRLAGKAWEEGRPLLW